MAEICFDFSGILVFWAFPWRMSEHDWSHYSVLTINTISRAP